MGGKRDYELLLEIGHKSKPLKKKAPNGYTHQWTVYLKGVNDAKIEHCISRVVFQLHESFSNHHRVLTGPPYRIKETGYAGFELPIEVYFRNREKPNHVVYVHNLELLNTEKHADSHIEKVMFLNPNKDFEKCLIKAGAKALVTKSKEVKDKSDSPPVKKRKSASSLIPSKDMEKLDLQPSSNGQQTSCKAEPKSDFMDLFGAPLVYNKKHQQQDPQAHQHRHNHHAQHQPRQSQTQSQSHRSSHKSSQQSSKSHQSQVKSPPPTKVPTPTPIPTPTPTSTPSQNQSQSQSHSQSQSQSQSQTQQQSHTLSASQTKSDPQLPPVQIKQEPSSASDRFQTLQASIASLDDCERLQKIVDIIEESGEWFNLTARKFVFDLKRLDKKTLQKIERCLH